MDLFEHQLSKDLGTWTPLAERMRPTTLDRVVGQSKLLQKGASLRTMVEQDDLISMIFWGPPGTGKTTVARLIAQSTKSTFVELSAVMSGVPEIRTVLQRAHDELAMHRKKTILFIDEIHRLNKSQQDALLPAVEKGTILLIGATTENPSFEVNRALLSRSRVFIFERVTAQDIEEVLKKAIVHEIEFRKIAIGVDSQVIKSIASLCDGDVRQALTMLDLAIKSAPMSPKGDRVVTLDSAKEALQKSSLSFDKQGEEFYHLISALHKSLRGSDENASIYWLARMLEGGVDPSYLSRRLVRFASEDIGLADNQALVLAIAVSHACEQLGLPECKVHLAHLIGYLARAPKSIEAYEAYNRASDVVHSLPIADVPLHLRNAPTGLMKELGYGKEYHYTPSNPQKKQDFLPAELKDQRFW